jgi:hypothetical protein
MLDYKTQTQLVDATAAMLRSYLTATTNTLAASTWRGLSLWAEMVGVGAAASKPAAGRAPTLWPSMSNWMSAPPAGAWQAWPWSLAGIGKGLAPFAGAWPGQAFSPGFSMWSPMPDWSMWSRASLPMWNAWLAPLAAPAPARPAPVANKPAAPEPAPYASYRSAGGHAAAQVIVPGIMPMPVAEIAEVTTTVVLSPMHTMLGVWRAALGR